MEDPQQQSVTLDFSKAMPISGTSPAQTPDPGASALGGALLYASQQDPVKYAKRLQLQKLTGIPPQVSEGNEEQVKVAADAKALDPHTFTATNPRTAQWAANPDNAAVSGVPEIQRLGGIEQNVQQMDGLHTNAMVSAYTPTMWESLKGKLSNAWDATKQNLYAFPLTRMAVSTVGGLAGTVGDVGSFVGWHGDGPTKQNMLQSIESSLKPENVFKGDPYAGVASYSKSNGMDQVAPLLASMAVGVGEGSAVTWAAKTFGWSERAAKVATALSVGATFSAQQGGAAYTQVAGAGGDDDAARLAANRTFAINLPGNTLAGFADMIPGLKDNPLLAQAGTGALMGASGQVGSNIVTGKPLTDGLLMATGKAAAIQAGLHLGMSQFHANLAQAVEAANASELKTRSPQTFEDAIGAIAGGGPSLRIPVEEFNSYFAGQKIDPQAAAQGLGATNYAEAHLSGGDVEVPKAGYLAKLDQAHQMGLFPHIVDPVSDLTPTQWEQGRQELTEWEAGGGTAKLQADVAAADAETAASPEHAAVKEDLRGRYVAAGETPEVAETLATKDANVFTNLAREANLKPSELVAMYNPKVTVGEAPSTATPEPRPEYLYHGTNTELSELQPRSFVTSDPKEALAYALRNTSKPLEGDGTERIYAVSKADVQRSGEEKIAGEHYVTTEPHAVTDVTRKFFSFGHDGKATTLLTPARELAAKYRLVEADSLTPSHNAQTFEKNAAYPDGLQERAYDTSKEAQSRVIQQGQNYDPRYTVNTNPDAVNGPPVVTPDGIVLGGNSRAMSTQRHYEGGGTEYKAALKEQAAAYGFTPEQVEGMKKPVLVREVPQPATADDARRLGSELNKSMTGAMGVSERAVSAGKNLKPETLRRVADMMQADDSTLREAMGKHGAAIVKMLTDDGVITDRERPQFVDTVTGGLSEEGKTFVERALMGSVIDDPRLMDAAPKSVLSKLERSLGAITSFASREDEWNLLPVIRQAVGELGVIQRSGNSLETHLGQVDMFGAERNPLVDAMVRALDGKPNEVRKAFADFAHDADENLPGQSRMFGEASAFDAFNHAFGSKLTEQEYHDGLDAGLEKEVAQDPNAPAAQDAPDDEGVSGGSGGDAAPGGAGGEGSRKLGSDVLYQKAITDIRGVVEAAKESGHAPQKATIGPVVSSLVEVAKEHGQDLEGFNHVIDGSAIRHTLKKHGNDALENQRGQVAVTDADFEKIPEILASPDFWIFGTKNSIGRDQIVSVKRMADDSTLYIEEIRRGKKELATSSMWKYPATMDVSRIESAPHHYVRGDSENEPIVVRNPNAVKGDGTLFQSAPEGQPRGWFRTLPDGSFEIGKTKIGDLSTFVHEPAHAYLHMLRDLAGRESASETLKSDYSKVLKFLDAKDGEVLTVEQQEKWAQANEQYLREGKAPSPGLRGVFTRFSVWLGSVYKKASDIGVELSAEIRDVFDRMYAAEEGVNRAAAEAGPHLFRTPEEAGWTEEQYKRYAADNNMTTEQAKADIIGRLNEAAVRDRSAAWREEERNVREAVTAQVDAQREYKAIRSLRKGDLEDGTPLTLLKDALVHQFGEERVKALQELHPGLYRVDGLTDAETAAELHGFSSGEEMMKALEATPRRSVAIDTATRDFMTAKHGDIRYDGTLDDQARLAVENDNRSKALHQELTALKAKVGELRAQKEGEQAALRSIEVAPISAYRDAAYQMVQKKAIVDLQPTRYLDASRKYSTEAFDAVRRGDVEAAAEAKHKELLNHFLYREAMAEKEFVTKQFTPFVKRVQGKTAQQNLGKAGPEYRAQFNKLMARYEIAFVANAELPEGTLAEWASNQYDMGKEPSIEQGIYDESRTASYRTIPISELHHVHDALMNIRALAYQELRMTVNGRRVEFAQATADMMKRATESLESRPSRVFKRNATFGEKAADFVQRGDALLMRTERLMEWLDGGKTGPWHDNLWHLAADSQGREYALQEEVTKKIGDSLEALPKEQRMKMAEKVMIDGITEPIKRHDLVSMALNMGNDGNFDRLTKTFEAHGWNPDALEQVKGALTREEWQHVQNLWEMLKPLGEHMKAMERRLTGVPPAMVKPTPFRVEFADGTHMNLDGGYYPIMMDSRFSKIGAAADAGMSAQNLMETGYGRAETSKGYTKGRTGYGGPLLLDYEQVLTQHTAKVIKDITHREFMLTANKLLMDQGIRSTLSGTLGAAYEEQMMPWLRTIINDRNGSATQGLGDFSRWMRAARTNMVMATIPFKIGTSLLQWTHAPRMLLSTNAGSFAQSLVAFMAHPSEMTEQIRELSPNEMKFRGDDLDRDIRAAMSGQPGMRKKIAEVGGMSIKYTDHLLSFPLWHSAYQDALKEHIDLPEDEAQYQAVQKADSAVRLGLGSASPKDLPPIMRNNDFAKFFTTFYSFHNGIYGQVRDIAHQVNGWGDVPKMTYGLALAVVVPSLIGSLVTGHGPKDDENVGLWAAKRALLFSSDTIPIVRDVAAALDRGGDVKFNPLMDVASKGAKTVMTATADKEDKDWTGIGLGALETAGDLGGVPGTAQAMKPLRYLDSVSKGKVENPSVWDAFVGSGSSGRR